MGFSTLEDVNGAVFDNQGFWWHKADLSKINSNDDFTDVKVDFCTISRTKLSNGEYQFTVIVDNELWTKGFNIEYTGTKLLSYSYDPRIFPLTFKTNVPDIVLCLYMGNLKINLDSNYKTYDMVLRILSVDDIFQVKYNQLHKPFTFVFGEGSTIFSHTVESLEQGYVLLYSTIYLIAGYVFVELLKTDFQFTCNQDLIVGEVNTVCLGTHSDYKPNGDLVGEYETKLSVLYNNNVLPVTWNNALNDYTFDLDLTNVQSTGKVRFTVLVEANEVLNATETEVVLNMDYQGINSISKLQTLFKNGGTGRLTGNLTFNNDLTVSNGVTLLGDANTINLNGHKIVISNDLTFKADTVLFTNGVNSIQQQTGTNVELTDCIFTGCTGFGSVIDCQVDINNLNDEDDFRTVLTRCSISNSDMMILHGGNLQITECKITGKISNKNYPYCLYQTDGSANIQQTEFKLVDGTVFDYDLLFNPCIFIVGENATINGLSHSDLQTNHVPALLGDARNTSIIDVTYKYNLIEDTINLKATNGFCHSVSGEDFVFKTNVTLNRV